MNKDLINEYVEKWHKAGERFKDLVCTATNRNESEVSLRSWSLQIHIFQVTVGFDWYFSISGGLLNLLNDETIMGIIEKFMVENPPCEEEIRSYCFIDQMFNINDIFEIQERIHVLYLDPVYCQKCSLIWDDEENTFKTNVNGSSAFFAYKDILKANDCARDLSRFKRWVSETQYNENDELEPFLTKSLIEKQPNSKIGKHKPNEKQITATISSDPYKSASTQ